jgi:alkaline phosphatase
VNGCWFYFRGMRYSLLPVYACVSFFIFSCHSIRYTTANAHAHNDYAHPVPFYTAWEAGFGSVEADVFPVNDSLYVAHDSTDISPSRSLYRLYIQPLLVSLQQDSLQHIRFLVDIKKESYRSLNLLLAELHPLVPYLRTPEKNNRVTLLVTGSRPLPSQYGRYPSFVFFDDDLKRPHTSDEWARVGLVSLPFNKISSWKGHGTIDKADLKALQHKIDSVHAAGKPIRFWAAPDTEASWKLQQQMHADLIGTDNIAGLAAWLRENKTADAKP